MRLLPIRRPSHHRQRGATAIEFSIVFALLFAVFWAIISYAMPFFLLQVMNRASAEAVRYAVRADTSLEEAAYETKVKALAGAELERQLRWLPPRFRTPFEPYTQRASIVGDYLVVRLNYASYNTNPIVPVLRLPGLGPIPNIPGDLVAESRLRLP